MQRHTFIVNSLNRTLTYSNDPTNFRINMTPNVKNVKELVLESVSLPFAWQNVVPEYGNQLRMIFSSVPGGIQTIDITLETGFYTIDQLITTINTVLNAYYLTLPLAPALQICPFQLVIDPIKTKVVVIYDPTNYGAVAGISFDIGWGVNGVIRKPFHVYQMLGLSIVNQASNNFAFGVGASLYFPLAVSNRLPINYILINIEELPSTVQTTGGKCAQFYVDVTNAVINGDRVNAPIYYRHYQDFYNSVIIHEHQFTLKELVVSLTDSQGLPLTSQNPREWSMAFSYIRDPKNR